MALNFTFYNLLNYADKTKYNNYNPRLYKILTGLNSLAINNWQSSYTPYCIGLEDTKQLYAGKQISSVSNVNTAITNGLPLNSAIVNQNQSPYSGFTFFNDSVVLYIEVTQIKNITVADNYVYNLIIDPTYANITTPKINGSPITASQFKTTYGEYYIVTYKALYKNVENVSTTTPRTLISSDALADIYYRIAYMGADDPNNDPVLGGGDLLFPCLNLFLNPQTSVNSGKYTSSANVHYCSTLIGALNFGCGYYNNLTGNLRVEYTAFPYLSDIKNFLNNLGIPWAMNLNDVKYVPINNFPDYVPAGQPSDTTGGGTGAGDNSSDSVTQTSPSISSISAFNAHYSMSKTMIDNLSNYIWSANFLDNIKLLFNDPAEGIISCKMFPFSINDHDTAHIGALTPIKIGNVTTDVSGYPITNGYNAYFNLGSITIDEYFGSALDYAPYTTIQIYLPYIGYKDLDTTEVMNSTITITYIIDITTGACIAEIWKGQLLLYTYDGKIGIDIPLSSSNASQYSTNTALSALSGVAGIITGGVTANPVVIAGSVITTAKSVASNQMHINKGGINSPSVSLYMPQNVFIVISRPIQSLSSTFGSSYGFPCNVSKQLGTLKGYTEIDKPILNNIGATQQELAEIKSLLETGVIFT